MKANELRIGNWVVLERNEIPQNFKVAAIDVSNDDNAILILENESLFYRMASDTDGILKPIPITRELLYKIGAKDFPDGESLILNDRLISFAGCRDQFFDKSSGVDLKTLHQFQNLYFALTGTELEIKL